MRQNWMVRTAMLGAMLTMAGCSATPGSKTEEAQPAETPLSPQEVLEKNREHLIEERSEPLKLRLDTTQEQVQQHEQELRDAENALLP